VLGSPDDQDLGEEAEAYEALTGEVLPLRIGKAPARGEAWVLRLTGKWERVTFKSLTGDTGLVVKGGFQAGMSGSPIVATDGNAIGVVTVDRWNNPRLTRGLPMRFLPVRIVGQHEKKAEVENIIRGS
jgi:hypothetical protein